MRTPTARSGLLTFAALGVASCGMAGFVSSQAAPTGAPVATPEQTVFFETKVRPVLVASCVSCHGGSSPMGGLRLDGPDGVAKVVGRGGPEGSLFVHAIRQDGALKMPPGGKLKASEIADLETWVKMGAPWPAKPVVRKQDLPLWSLKPVGSPKPPKVKDAAWVRNPIDAFILARLEAEGLKPSKEADRRTLIRRLSYDLAGLPPTAAETDAFLADKAPGAYERVVDRLLASPQYGERWARQWMDVARYADTKGYAFVEDRGYPNAYTYRDWLIKALNADLPYDRFVMEQLAADRLPETQGDDKAALAAMGYLTLGRRFLNQAPDIIDDRIDVTMRGLQGFTVACARCHDHKFDPIPTQDYYSLYAVFDSSNEDQTPISPRPIRDPWTANNARMQATAKEFRELVLGQMRLLRAKPTSDEVKKVLQAHREYDPAEGDALAKILPAFEPSAQARLKAIQAKMEGLQKNAPPSPEFAMAMTDRGDAHDGVVFKRGNPGNRGEAAPRRFLAALSKGERKSWTDGSGRLDLARSIASRDNPLTARVFVNRLWMGHVGQAIVRTPSDFGHQGEPPTHPELLDWLAADFMDHGWSIKRTHRLIVTSATYRQSSDPLPAMVAADPENRLVGRMNRRRLDLEQMRDSLTAASGRLDLKAVGGRSVDLWSRPFSPRRAVYGFVERQNLPGIFRTFDFASPDATSPRRFYTTVPQQALFFLNSPFVVEQARTLAARPEIATAKDDGQRVRRLYRLLLDRLPDSAETADGVAYFRRGEPAAPKGAWSYGYGSGGASFTPFAFFGDGRYRMKAKFPEDEFGFAMLEAGGGHPGRDAAHGVVRRWTAPASMTVSVSGVLRHPADAGDGVRVRVVSRRSGVLGEWAAHHGETRTTLASVAVQKGDTLDFVVDPLGGDNSDGFAYAPTVSGPAGTWDAASGFGGPPPPPLSRVTLFAQALLMSDEFVFVD